MNGFSIILIISILAEIVIYLRNIRYIKSYLTTNKLEQLYKFYKEIENEKDKKTVLELILNQERIEILRIDYFKSISFPQS